VILAVAAASATTVAAWAAPDEAPVFGKTTFDERTPPGCFFVRDIGDRTVGGPHTLYFKVKDQSHMHSVAFFHIETLGDCNTGPTSEDQHHAYRIRSTDPAAGDAAMICNPSELWISFPACRTKSVELMTPAEVAALPHGIRP